MVFDRFLRGGCVWADVCLVYASSMPRVWSVYPPWRPRFPHYLRFANPTTFPIFGSRESIFDKPIGPTIREQIRPRPPELRLDPRAEHFRTFTGPLLGHSWHRFLSISTPKCAKSAPNAHTITSQFITTRNESFIIHWYGFTITFRQKLTF